MAGSFDWYESKARKNRSKHGVSFEEAITVFEDPQALFHKDDEHSISEDRWHVLGLSEKGRLLLVVSVERVEGSTRVVSARKATLHEMQDYVQTNR